MSSIATPVPPGGRHPLLAAMDAVEAALTGTDDFDPMFLTTAEKEELLVLQQRVLGHVTGRQVRTMAAAAEVAEAHGARSVADWLAHRCRLRPARLAGLARLGKRLASYPVVAGASATGGISAEHARAVVDALDALPAQIPGHEGLEARRALVGKAEAHLLAECGHFTPPEVRILGRRLLEVLAPEAADAEEQRQLENEERRARARTALHLSRRGDGLTRIHGQLPDATAGILRAVLEAYTNPRHPDHHADHHGTDPTGERLTAAQLRGRALCALIEHLPVNRLPEHGGSPVGITVTLDYETLRSGVGAAVLDTGDRLSASAVRRLACQHGLIPVVLGGDSEPLDYGREQRLFSRAQRRAHGLRHRACQTVGCTIPAAWCEAHHTKPWAKGGRTDLKELAFLCWTHHHHAHDPRYQATWNEAGKVRFHRRT